MSIKLTERHEEYWRRNLKITAVLLVIWFAVTYVIGWYAVPISEINFFGWPLAYYMGAQGALIIYVLLIGYYAWYMRKLDLEYGVAEGEDE
jgi:putative solute:sodium symporter small subunit